MSKVRVCFFGTPAFAAHCLAGMLADEHYQIVGVVTQPDRPAGRKLELKPSEVKILAQKHGLPVLSPLKASHPESLQSIQMLGAEIAVVVAFGQILSETLLKSFPFGAVNVHASLLPRWRGAAPIQRAIEAGDSETGVCLQKMVKELDAGDLLGSRTVPIPVNLSAIELHDILAEKSVELLHVELMDYIRGNLAPIPQDSSQVTYAKKILKEESRISWTESALNIHNRTRAFQLGPGVYFLLGGKKIKLLKTSVAPSFDSAANSLGKGGAGQIVAVLENSLLIRTGAGVLEIHELQPESRGRMSVRDFLKGHPVKVGDLCV